MNANPATGPGPLTAVNNGVAQAQIDAQTNVTDSDTLAGDSGTLMDYVNENYGPGSANPDLTLVTYATTVNDDADDVGVDAQQVLNDLTALTTIQAQPPARLVKKARTAVAAKPAAPAAAKG